ncbi:MAG: TonB family protein [Campylobacterota bacterium]|nr:TonB family protein [Campylobacterota bacterium]
MHSRHNSLLLLSSLLTAFMLYAVVKNSKYITISSEPYMPLKTQEKIVSIVITPTPVAKRQEVKIVKPKVIKKIIKKKVIKKVIPIKTEPVVEKLVQKSQVIQATPKPAVVKKEVKREPRPVVPVFDAQMKASFIAGLYEILNEKKYYPKMAKRRKLEGTVQVRFTLCKDGTMKNVFLHKSCGHKILDKAALKVLKSINTYRAIPDAVSMTSLDLNIPIKYTRHQ